mmetsp:Transcript_17521/g.48422  ORF Transcript_17521/g.48422 Transcript_17521/m.48422 type:complete len:144 (+) Transcript_17521:1263-1694(+)
MECRCIQVAASESRVSVATPSSSCPFELPEAQILDPVRTTVVCEGPARMLEVAGWFIHATSSPHSAVIGPATLPICKVKNKFALQDSELVGGYRDLMFCGVLEGAGGLRIIGEVQIHDRVLHDLKTLMHKLYRIRRAKAASGV